MPCYLKISTETDITIKYNLPPINLGHLRKMTTKTAMIQFSRVNQPDLKSGYTLDDNARALVAVCMYFNQTLDQEIISDIYKYLGFYKNFVSNLPVIF